MSIHCRSNFTVSFFLVQTESEQHDEALTDASAADEHTLEAQGDESEYVNLYNISNSIRLLNI